MMGDKAFEFYYSAANNKPSAARIGPWKMHIRFLHKQST